LSELTVAIPRITQGKERVKHYVIFLMGLAAFVTIAAEGQPSGEGLRQKFVSGGLVRMHLSAGGYTITPTDSEEIAVTCDTGCSGLRNRDVTIKPAGFTADVYVEHTPHNNFQATIEVPRKSNLWVRLTAGGLTIEAVEGDKNLEVWAGEIEVEVIHPEEYGHRDASVTLGGLDASAFDVSKGGMFRSFEQQGPGKYRFHARVLAGSVDVSAPE
jgi:hypothetical protein